MMKQLFFTCLFFVWLPVQLAIAQEEAPPYFRSEKFDGARPWTHLDFHNNPDNFQFAIVTDRTGGHRDGVFEKGVEKLNLLQPEFVMCVGDLIEGYTKDSAEVNAQWDEFHAILKPLEMPFFYLPGNHDFSNSMMKNQWLQRYGRDYYYFVYKNVLMITMNTNDGDGVMFGQEQIDYVKKVLEENKNVRWTFIYMHHPIWSYGGVNKFTEIEEALGDRPFTILAGHTHRYMHTVNKGRNYYVLATTGGGSDLHGPKFGQFDHVTWVTMNDKGPTFVNLKLDGIIDHNISNEETAKMADDLLNSIKFEHLALLAPQKNTSGAKSIGFQNMSAGGELKLKINNTSDKPLLFEGRFYHNHHIDLETSKFSVTIPPKSSQQYEVPFAILKAIPLSNLDPIEMDWTMGYETLVNEHEFKLEGIHSISFASENQAFDLVGDPIFISSQKVALKNSFEGAEVHYTVDGTEPTMDSPVFTESITVSETTTFRARAFGKEGAMSSLVEKTFKKAIPLKAEKTKKTKPGLTYRYYEGEFLKVPDFATLKPLASGVAQHLDVEKLAKREDHYALLFEGYVEVPQEGVYTFYTYSDDGSQLLIGSELVVDNDGSHDVALKSGKVALMPGKHKITIRYFEDFSGETLRIRWEGNGLKRSEIPFEKLSH